MSTVGCSQTVTPVGEICNAENGFSQVKALFPCAAGVEFATGSAASVEANWNTFIIDEKMFPLLDIKEVEPMDFELAPYESPSGEKTDMGDGVRGFRVKVNVDLYTHQKLRDYKPKYMFYSDRSKTIYATSPDGTKLKPFKLGYFKVHPMATVVAGTPAFTFIDIQFADIEEFDTEGVVISNPPFIPTQLAGITRVTITQVGTISSNSYVIDVAFKNTARLDGQNSGAVLSAPISGLVAANFLTLDGSSESVAILTATESSTVAGRYTIAHTAFTAGSSKVVATEDAKQQSIVTALL